MPNQTTSVHEQSIVIDGLFCHMEEPIPPTEEIPGMMFEHIIASGVTAFSNSVIADSYPTSMPEALSILYASNLVFDAFPDQVVPIRCAKDINEAKETGRVGMILSTQGLACVGEDVRNVWVLHELGVRIMQLTYNEHNTLGSGCMEPNDHGLTRRGQQVIEHMDGLGATLDVSHVGERTSMEAIAYSKRIPIVSHAGLRRFNPNRRNVTDDLVRAIADKGGVVGLCPHSVFIEASRGQRPTIDDYLCQIQYVAELVGVDHIGVGTDNFQTSNFFSLRGRAAFARTLPTFFGGYSADEKHAAGFSQWSDWPHLTDALLGHGFSEADTKKIMGENFLRVFMQTWDAKG